ncbi:N-acetyltransferase [Leptotrichia sp. OH3620_COT-345]|uniref:GNAT family N-acetyltransferase n=1 Tax=Leptotrichia sp. OH3620_COT-345 TaxID=2491048 RepID=UPI000F64A768|nr:N-acetyltransferase [Leptotrichia sp. OH3620_COT-345]RRD38466.1 N-acetyltransferase [Leptotrichia sp. OH3620_COT-345]
MNDFYIRELDAMNDSELLFEIVEHENIVFEEASVGNWNIKPFAKYGKVFAMLHKKNERERLVSIIEVLRSFDGKKAYLYGVSAVPEYEKKGHTRKLLEYVVSYLESNNIFIIELTVSVDNERAIKIYKKMGFKIVENLQNEYGDNEARYLMRYQKYSI